MLLYLSLAIIGAFAVRGLKNTHKEQAVGTHKVHGNVALYDANGNTVKASCGQKDRRQKLTHGRTEWIDGVQWCVDWNAGTSGNDAVSRRCDAYGMKCCDEDQVLMEEISGYSGELICKYDVPMCMKHSTKERGYVSFEPTKCNFGNGDWLHCGGGISCCDEGSNDIDLNSGICRSVPRAPQPERQPVVEGAEPVEFGCNADFKDSEGEDCDIYGDDGYCDEYYYDDYKNPITGETARVCPQCGCTEGVQLFSAISQVEATQTVVYGFAAIGVLALMFGVKNFLTKKLDYETVNDTAEV